MMIGTIYLVGLLITLIIHSLIIRFSDTIYDDPLLIAWVAVFWPVTMPFFAIGLLAKVISGK